jgi:hypothetical protein
MSTSATAITPATPLLPPPALTVEVSAEYEGHTYVNLPSMWNVFYAPLEIWEGAKALFATKLLPGSHEMILDAGMRLIQAPVLFSQGLTAATLNVINIARATGLFHVGAAVANNLLRASVALGLIVCTIEMAFETPSFCRTAAFARSFKTKKRSKIIDFQTLKATDEKSAMEQVRNRIQKFLDQPEILHDNLTANQANAALDYLKKQIKLKPTSFKYHYTHANNYLDEIENLVENSILAKTLTKLQNDWLSITPQQEQRLDKSISPSERADLEATMLQQNKNRLAGRVMACGVSEVTSKLPNLLKVLQPQPTPVGIGGKKLKDRELKVLKTKEIEAQAQARAAANELLKNLEIQAKKKLKFHKMGFAAIGLTVLGIGIGIAFPYVGLAFGIVAGIVSMSRWIYLTGACNDLGSEFKWSRCWMTMRGSIRTLLQTPLQLFRWLK